MKHKTPKLNKIFAILVAACLVLGLLPLVTMPPAQATTTGRWDVYGGSSVSNLTYRGSYTSLHTAFNQYLSYTVTQIHHTGSNVAYDLGAVHPAFSIGSGKTLILTGNPCTYWNGHTNNDMFRMRGGTLYVGQNITLQKRGTWAAVGARDNTTNYLYVFGAITHERSNEFGFYMNSGTTYTYQRSGATFFNPRRDGGTHSWNTVYTLNVSRGANVASVSHSPLRLFDVPFFAEGINAFTSGASVTVSGTPNTGYYISGGAGTYTMNQNRSVTVTATANTYPVTYNANGGSGAPGNQTKTHGVNLTLSSVTPTRPGYTFNGWNTMANGSGTRYNPGAVYTGNTALSLFAQWEQNKTVSGNVRIEYTNEGVDADPALRTSSAEIELLRRLPGGEYGVFRIATVNFNTGTEQRENGILFDEKPYTFNDLPPIDSIGRVYEYAVRVDLVNYNATITGNNILLEYDPSGFTAGFEITPGSAVTGAVMPRELYVKILYYHYTSNQSGIISQHSDFHVTATRDADGIYRGTYPVAQRDGSNTPFGYNITVTGYILPNGDYVPVYDEPEFNPAPAGYAEAGGGGFDFSYGSRSSGGVTATRMADGTAGWVKYNGTDGADGTITASFTPSVYTISYEPNGGEIPSGAPTSYYYGRSINIPRAPARGGFTYQGWYDNAAFTGTPITSIGARDKGNVSLHAKWTRNFGSVEYNDNTNIGFAADGKYLERVFDYTVNGDDRGITEADRAEGNFARLTLTVTDLGKNAPGAEQINEFAGREMLQFFDISVHKIIETNGTSAPPVKLIELPVNIEVTIELPEGLSGKTGYTVYRYHGDSVEPVGNIGSEGEDYVISRTSDSGRDQIIIYTSRFSTFGIAENVNRITIPPDSLEPVEAGAYDVQARIVDTADVIYKIDIEWGGMKFEYVLEGERYDTDAGAVIWKPAAWEGMDGDNNKITVTNHSNADVNVSLDITENLLAPDVDMEVFTTNVGNSGGGGTPAKDLPLEMVLYNMAPLSEADWLDAYLWLGGVPFEPDPDPFHDPETWHRVGIITVTIIPDAESERRTPR